MPFPPPSFQHDCSACHGLCCVAPQFSERIGFGFAKPALEPCRHLDQGGYRCAIHARLDAAGCTGCVDFTCHGAGPLVTRHWLERGVAWAARRPGDPRRRLLLESFLALHALFAALAEARRLAVAAPPLQRDIAAWEARMALLDTAQLLDAALDLAFEIRTRCWAIESSE